MDAAAARSGGIDEADLVGFKYFKAVLPLLDRLHDNATARDRAHNRILHFDRYCSLILLFFFNPIVTSMRGIVQASALDKVRKKLGVKATSLGSFSESAGVFDPELLREVIGELAGRLQPPRHDPRLDDVKGLLTLVDGTELTALSRLIGLACEGRAIKLHTHFDALKGVPLEMRLSAASASEVRHLEASLLPGRVYVTDRGYACFELMQKIIDASSSFVCRVRDNSSYQVIEDRPLTAQARAAGILSDQVVWLGCRGKSRELHGPVRLIKIACTPHRKRYKIGRGGPEQGESLLIATDLLDLPAEVIALIFKNRWAVELFFRTFKHLLGCRHLLCHREEGIRIQVYLAMIACMLIALWTGKKPNKRTLEMLQFYFTGWASPEELEAHIGKLKEQNQ